MDQIKIITGVLTKQALSAMAAEGYGEMIKAVVDVAREVLAVGGELHADAEAALLDHGSEQKYLWGVNLYPEKNETNRIEFTSFINIRPRDGNRSLEIQDEKIKEKICTIVGKRIDWGS